MRLDYPQISMFHPKLIEVMEYLERKTGLGYTITSLHRPDDPGVHGTMPLRADDLRCRDEVIGERICDIINSRYDYDRERPEMKVAIAHGEGANYHVHLQVHPNTKAKNEQ